MNEEQNVPVNANKKKMVNTESTISSKASSFMAETTAHGFAQIGSGSSRPRRVVYLLVVLASSAFFLYNFTENIIAFVDHDSYLNTLVKLRPSVDMPSVTICSYAYHTRSAMERLFPDIPLDLYTLGYSFPTMFGRSVVNTTLEIPGMGEYNNFSFSQLNSELVPQINETFILCYVKGRPTDCSQLVTSFLTDYGVCYVTHSIEYTREHGVINSSLSRQSFGFRFVLDANPDDYINSAQAGSRIPRFCS